MNDPQIVARFLRKFGGLCRHGDVAALSPVQRAELESKVSAFVAQAQPIRLTLPGFPLKSPAREDKVLGVLPDAGEHHALAFLDRFCETVKTFYAPGCVIDLFSDGLTFNDLLNIPRSVANAYHRELRTLCDSPNLVWHSYSTADPSFDRDKDDVDTVLAPYWPAAPAQSAATGASRPLNGREVDLAMLLAREQHSVLAEMDAPERRHLEARARRMAERGIALDGFLAAKLPPGVRLTVHAPKRDTAKVPVRLHAKGDDGSLPWHSVLLSQLNGEWLMLSKSDVTQKFDAAIVSKGGKPWYFAEGGAALGADCEISVVHRDDFGLLITPRGAGVGEVDCLSLSAEAIAALTKRYGFVVLRGFRVDDEAALVKFTGQFGRPYIWQFGAVHKVRPEKEASGYVHSFESVPLHWDLSMLPLTHPLVQEDEFFAATLFALYCKTAPQPGEAMTTLVDARHIVRQLDDETRAAWERVSLTYNTKMTYFGGVPRTFPLISTHPETGEKVLRYQEGSESSLQRFEVSVATPGIVPDDIIQRVNELAYAPDNLVEHDWVTGDIVMVDNYNVLHGRRAMSDASAARELWRVQVY